MEELKKRGWSLGPKRKDEYVDQLLRLIRNGGSRDFQVVERLLFSALIEARSCERFRLLSKEITDPGLSQFYYELMVSEAGHYKNFLLLAKEYMSEDVVMARWRELLEQEAHIVKNLEVRGDRMH
jgi:tRNA-(ms[2]io[6]A)-hydroxylase